MGLKPAHTGTMRKLSDHFGAFSENVRNIKRDKVPSRSERIPGVVFQIDTTENPTKANIQGVEIYLVKINNKVQIPTVPEGREKLYGGRSRLANNPEKVCIGKSKIKRCSLSERCDDR